MARKGPQDERIRIRRHRGGCLLRALAVLLLLLVIAAVIIGVLLITNADTVLSWLNDVLRQIQQLPFVGAGGG